MEALNPYSPPPLFTDSIRLPRGPWEPGSNGQSIQVKQVVCFEKKQRKASFLSKHSAEPMVPFNPRLFSMFAVVLTVSSVQQDRNKVVTGAERTG